MVEPQSPTADNLARALEEVSALNNIFNLSDCVGEKLTLEVVLRYGSCKLVIAPLAFAARYCCSVFLRKNGRLGEFYRLLMADWVCYRFLTVKGVAYGEDYELESVTGKSKTGSGVKSNQLIGGS